MGLKGQNPHYYTKDKRTFLTLANLLVTQTDRYKEAYGWTKRALQLEPEWEEAHYMMGRCLFSMGRYYEAIAPFEKTVS